jgi:hypothetical protein
MREIRQSGSVRGVRRNPYPYRDPMDGVPTFGPILTRFELPSMTSGGTPAPRPAHIALGISTSARQRTTCVFQQIPMNPRAAATNRG